MKIGIIYWSQTGNTETMANAILEGVKEKGVDVDCISVSEITSIDNYDKVIFGCPSMGNEVLEEDEFEPFFSSIEKDLTNKKIALFGSYDWGDGQWMRDWEERCQLAGAILYEKGLIINLEPDNEGIQQCKELGKNFCEF